MHAQRLDVEAPFGNDARSTPAAIAHLGYLQIDTIHVIERCHHHILFTRIPGYRREHLHQAQTLDKTVFEYWAHALAYMPTVDFRYHVRDMRNYLPRTEPALQALKQGDVARMVARVRRDGPLNIRDIEDEELLEKVGDRVVAALDLKADRKASRLMVQMWNWVGAGSTRAHKRKIEDALHAFERFQFSR